MREVKNELLEEFLETANQLINIMRKILGEISKPDAPRPAETVVPLEQRPRTKRYPLREDPGTIFRSRPGYNWVCPYCHKSILEDDMVIAFQPKPGARTTYAHLECDEAERKLWE